MKLLIAGDVVIRKENIDAVKVKKEILENGLDKIWESADFRIFNLESPITNSENKIKKSGPNLKSTLDSEEVLKKLKPNLVVLANNHIRDYNNEGIKDTINILEKNEINYIGVKNVNENSAASYIINKDNVKVGIYNCCETEFSVTDNNNIGANGCDYLELYEDIKFLKENSDYLIIMYHGGKEHYRYPSPNLQKLCRKMIEYGADCVTCQHSHCIGCVEEYKDGHIIYGQGNFIFNKNKNEFWETSIILEIEIDKDFSIKYIPIQSTISGTKLAQGNEKREILESMEHRAKEIQNDKFVKEKYIEFSQKNINRYLRICHGNNVFLKLLSKLHCNKILDVIYSEKKLLALLNILECEAHRELLIQGLKTKINNNSKGKVKK